MVKKPKEPKEPKSPKAPKPPKDVKKVAFNPNIRVAFASKNFISGQQVRFKLYDFNENLIENSFGNEWANTGVYYKDYNLNLNGRRTYLCIAEEVSGVWQASKLITKNDKI